MTRLSAPSALPPMAGGQSVARPVQVTEIARCGRGLGLLALLLAMPAALVPAAEVAVAEAGAGNATMAPGAATASTGTTTTRSRRASGTAPSRPLTPMATGSSAKASFRVPAAIGAAAAVEAARPGHQGGSTMISRRLVLAISVLAAGLASLAPGAGGRPAAVLERRPGQAGDPRLRPRHHRTGEPRLRAARPIGSPPSTRTARSGSSTRSTARSCSRSTGWWRWHPSIPEWKTKEPFKTVLSGDREAMAKLSLRDLEEIVVATHAGMSVEAFNTIAADWAAKATDHRWHKPYTELVYQPMLEVLALLRANGFRTYIVTGGGQAFVRSYAGGVYGVAAGRGDRLLARDRLRVRRQGPGRADQGAEAGAEQQQLRQGRGHQPVHRPAAAGAVRQLRPATARCWSGPRPASGKRLGMLVLHDDRSANTPTARPTGLPDTKVGTFTQALMDEATAARLDGDQHEERLEADLRLRAVGARHPGTSQGESRPCPEFPPSRC